MTRSRSSPPRALYGADLAAWAEVQAAALREGRVDEIDRDHLTAVLGGLAAEQRQELQDRLGVIVTGLLRWAEQVDLRGHSWAATIEGQRIEVARILRQNPSLRAEVPALISDAYAAAKARAVLESALFDDSFSASCPFTDDEVLRGGFLPDPYGDDAIRGEGWWRRGR